MAERYQQIHKRTDILQEIQESRVKKTLLNARVNLIFYFLTLVLSFFSRKIFLSTLGADFIGLTGTLQNLLGFLNLAELGIGSAIGYVLYKPIFEHDRMQINEIISVMGYLYRIIGLVILAGGCILALFLPLIFPDTEFDLGLIYFAYFSFLASSLIGYFINYRQNLLGADQRNYVVTGYFQSITILKTLIQMASAWYTGSYHLWVAVELSFGIIYSFILNWRINRTYPWLKTEVKLGRQLFRKYPEVMTKTKQLFVHKIGVFAQWQTIPLLIYAFSNLQLVAFYNNYTMITDKLSALVNSLTESSNAGVGNLIAEGNKSKILNVYWELFFARLYIAGIMVFGVWILMEPFIGVWIGSQYILPKSVLAILCINLFINQTNGTTGQFMFGYGLFKDTWVPVAQFVACVVLSSVFGHFYGLFGVLLGNTMSLFLFIYVWKPIFLFHSGFKESILLYVANLGKGIVMILIPAYMSAFAVLRIVTGDRLLSGVVAAIVYVILSFAIYYLCSKPFRGFVLKIYQNSLAKYGRK